MTSLEIAKLCGVSKTTVSRVINKDPKVKEETRAKVIAMMKEHNYVPIESARRLAGINSNIIGLFIMELDTDDSKTRVSNSSYFSKLVNVIVDQANNIGFQILVSIITNQSQLREANNLFLSKTIFSGIYLGTQNQSDILDKIINTESPIIIIDRQNPYKEIPLNHLHINLDNFIGGYNATNYLISEGHRKIAHITGDLKKLSGLKRFMGYKKALEDSGIDFVDSLVREGDFQEKSGYNMVKDLLENEKFTSVFVGNDEMAIGVYKGIKEAGLTIPSDIRVIGFDNIDIGEYLSPKLSTIDAPFIEIATEAVNALCYYNENSEFKEKEIQITTHLLVKES